MPWKAIVKIYDGEMMVARIQEGSGEATRSGQVVDII